MAADSNRWSLKLGMSELARRAIAAAGGIKPGEIVLLDGGRHAMKQWLST